MTEVMSASGFANADEDLDTARKSFRILPMIKDFQSYHMALEKVINSINPGFELGGQITFLFRGATLGLLTLGTMIPKPEC